MPNGWREKKIILENDISKHDKKKKNEESEIKSTSLVAERSEA